MKIKVFSIENQGIFTKISLNIFLSLRHCYRGGKWRLRWKSPTASPPNKPTRGWRRSRHLRRVQRPRQGAPENVQLPLRKSVAEPIF